MISQKFSSSVRWKMDKILFENRTYAR